MKLKRKKSKKEKKNRIILIIVILLIDIFLILSFIRINEAININNLNHRFYHLLEINITSDEYDNKLDTTGKYRTAEKAMNSYFIDYSKDVKALLDVISDNELTSLLSVDKYNNENNNLNNKISMIDKTREDLDNKFNKLYDYSKEDSIKRYIRSKTTNKGAIEVFNKYMLSIDAHDHFDDCNSILKAKQDEVNNILETSKEVYTFLINNEGKWLIKDNQIQFANGSLKEQYDGMVSKVK